MCIMASFANLPGCCLVREIVAAHPTASGSTLPRAQVSVKGFALETTAHLRLYDASTCTTRRLPDERPVVVRRTFSARQPP